MKTQKHLLIEGITPSPDLRDSADVDVFAVVAYL